MSYPTQGAICVCPNLDFAAPVEAFLAHLLVGLEDAVALSGHQMFRSEKMI